ncbi:hypothetical protein N483_16350 [Pseudoalteromonas luteoviolacea NCIMB 1944]|nr:hypothetical protein N483_16350 [Pseudoalteromonas luteoviolacea NCIMB 1944]
MATKLEASAYTTYTNTKELPSTNTSLSSANNHKKASAIAASVMRVTKGFVLLFLDIKGPKTENEGSL